MPFADKYFSRQTDFSPFVTSIPCSDLGIVVMIPCHREPFVVETLKSLSGCKRPPCAVEIIVVVNASADATPDVQAENMATLEAIRQWKVTPEGEKLAVHILHLPSMPPKHAGVGLARKVGMDEAAWRFNLLNRPEGIIVSLDADARVEKNYLTVIYEYFQQNAPSGAASVYFEHDDTDPLFSLPLDERIAGYELHLRYLVQAMRFAGLPYAYHTVGSSFAVRAGLYISHGGMNRRQAGEDFYFLHKIIPDTPFGEINNTVIRLSPRPSDRVPFGTGAAVGKMIATGSFEFATYRFSFFQALRTLTDNLRRCVAEGKTCDPEVMMLHLPYSMQDELRLMGIHEALAEIAANTTHTKSFVKRFFKWFDAFRMVKLANVLHMGENGRVPVGPEAALLLMELKGETYTHANQKSLLALYRTLDRQGWVNLLR